MVDILYLDNYSIFEKSIAKDEILRRLLKEKKRRDNSKTKHKTKNHNKNKKTKDKKWKRFEQVAQKTGLHTGLEHQEKYEEFISNGGDPNSCPFE